MSAAQERDDLEFSDRPDVLAAKMETRRLIQEGHRVADEATHHHNELRELLEAIRAGR